MNTSTPRKREFDGHDPFQKRKIVEAGWLSVVLTFCIRKSQLPDLGVGGAISAAPGECVSRRLPGR